MDGAPLRQPPVFTVRVPGARALNGTRIRPQREAEFIEAWPMTPRLIDAPASRRSSQRGAGSEWAPRCGELRIPPQPVRVSFVAEVDAA